MNEIDYLVVPTERSVEVKTSSILKQSVQRLRNTEINANWRTRLNTTQIYSEGRDEPLSPMSRSEEARLPHLCIRKCCSKMIAAPPETAAIYFFLKGSRLKRCRSPDSQ
jgi:hypothetical protein